MPKFLIMFSAIIVGVGIALYFQKYPLVTKSTQTADPLQQAVVSPTPNPTNTPFYDLTVPYLRNRDYKSELGSREEYSKNGTYTTYVTSYTSDGLKINGLLTIPAGEKPANGWPAIVFVHGYIPPKTYQTTERYVDYVDYLARNGFVVFKIDLRGHGNSEGQAGGGYYGSDYVIDTLNARAALQSTDFVNKEIGRAHV